jgi:hypothetical protein
MKIQKFGTTRTKQAPQVGGKYLVRKAFSDMLNMSATCFIGVETRKLA